MVNAVFWKAKTQDLFDMGYTRKINIFSVINGYPRAITLEKHYCKPRP